MIISSYAMIDDKTKLLFVRNRHYKRVLEINIIKHAIRQGFFCGQKFVISTLLPQLSAILFNKSPITILEITMAIVGNLFCVRYEEKRKKTTLQFGHKG